MRFTAQTATYWGKNRSFYAIRLPIRLITGNFPPKFRGSCGQLGVEMKRRGHDYRVASFEDFRPMIEEKGLEYIHLDGSAATLTQYLITEYVKVSDFMPGYKKLYDEFPGILDQIAEAVKGSDVATCENDFSGRTGRCFAFQRLRQGYILSRQCALWLAV